MRCMCRNFHSFGAVSADWAFATATWTTRPRRSSSSSTADCRPFAARRPSAPGCSGSCGTSPSSTGGDWPASRPRPKRRRTEPVQPGPSALERAQDKEAAAFVQRFLARLNDKKREIFVLAVLEEMNIVDVAAALSIPLNTAYTRLRSVRADFQKALARQVTPRPIRKAIDDHTGPTDELTMLARARAGLSPSPADAQRVRASLVAALAAPVNVAPDAAPSGSGQGARLVLSRSGHVRRCGGHRGGSRRILDGAPGGLARSPACRRLRRDERKTHRPRCRASSVQRLGPPRARACPPPSPRRPLCGKPPGGALAPRCGRGRPEVIVSATESLGQEVRALRAVERALRDADPRLALAILQQLDRDVPQGKLVEERRATSVIARCSAGDVPFGVDLAEDFASDHPESVYLGRVEQSCQRRGRGK